MNELFNSLGDWLSASWGNIGFMTLATTVFGVVSYYFARHVFPKAIESLVLILSKVISKLFGMEVEDVSDVVKKLPFIDNLKKMEHNILVQNEVKLIELKNKLVSPKLSEVERIAYQGVYDKLLEDLGDSLSFATAKVLNEIEKAAKKTIGL
jgi:hypothetical protein